MVNRAENLANIDSETKRHFITGVEMGIVESFHVVNSPTGEISNVILKVNRFRKSILAPLSNISSFQAGDTVKLVRISTVFRHEEFQTYMLRDKDYPYPKKNFLDSKKLKLTPEGINNINT